jgi:hypothetical protein
VGNPLGNAPDEPAQVIRAASVVHGQFLGTPVPGRASAFTSVRVAGTYNELNNLPTCYKFDDQQPASCAPGLHSDSKVSPAVTYVGRYPPLYYLLVGIPSLLSSRPSSIYAMRLCSVILSSALIALALATAWRWSKSRLLVAAVAAAATPMEFFLAGSVNPSSMEISSALCAWTAASILVLDHPRDPPKGLLTVGGVGVVLLMLARGPSALWVVSILVALLPVAWGRLDLRQWWARFDARIASGVVVVAAMVAGGWDLLAHGLAVAPTGVPPKTESTARIAAAIIRTFGATLEGAVGNFGWLNTLAPAAAVLIVGAVVAIPVVACLITGPGRVLTSQAIIVGLSVAAPFVLTLADARRIGFPVQARYFMPLWVGVPIFCAATISGDQLSPERIWRVARIMLSLSAIALGICFYWLMHRVTVGLGGPYSPLSHMTGEWHPPLSQAALDGLFLVGLLWLWYTLLKLCRAQGSAAGSTCR